MGDAATALTVGMFDREAGARHGSSLTAHGRWRSSKSINSELDRISGEGKARATTIRANYKAHSLHPVHHQPKDFSRSIDYYTTHVSDTCTLLSTGVERGWE
ncbi:unnamed protein product [Ectocarpus sp. CCAP 1310/34]|nr:unnamed protein product [Ectocarpus sp. CCAP 1310/34]